MVHIADQQFGRQFTIFFPLLHTLYLLCQFIRIHAYHPR